MKKILICVWCWTNVKITAKEQPNVSMQRGTVNVSLSLEKFLGVWCVGFERLVNCSLNIIEISRQPMRGEITADILAAIVVNTYDQEDLG